MEWHYYLLNLFLFQGVLGFWGFGYSWSTLLWYQCYYPHRSRDALSPVCGIFNVYLTTLLYRVLYCMFLMCIEVHCLTVYCNALYTVESRLRQDSSVKEVCG